MENNKYESKKRQWSDNNSVRTDGKNLHSLKNWAHLDGVRCGANLFFSFGVGILTPPLTFREKFSCSAVSCRCLRREIHQSHNMFFIRMFSETFFEPHLSLKTLAEHRANGPGRDNPDLTPVFDGAIAAFCCR